MRPGPRTTALWVVFPLVLVPALTHIGSSGTSTDSSAVVRSAPLAPGAGPASSSAGNTKADAGTPVLLRATLNPINHSGAHGSAVATLRGTTLSIRIDTSGLAVDLPHAQHIHIGASHTCPAPGATGGGVGGQVRSKDAKKTVGPIAVSLTTTGDTSPDSDYALDRFPVGDAGYDRTITVSPQVAADLRAGRGVIEQHGVDRNHDGRYDGGARSDAKPTLPQETSNTAACGRLQRAPYQVPVGGVAAGGGGTA
jgi:hypothetical protein